MIESACPLGIALLAPAQCALLHLGHSRCGLRAAPLPARRRKQIHLAVWLSLLLSMAALNQHAGWALALVLPLAALSIAGPVYVPMVRAWPRPTRVGCWLAAVAGIGLLIAACLGG